MEYTLEIMKLSHKIRNLNTNKIKDIVDKSTSSMNMDKLKKEYSETVYSNYVQLSDFLRFYWEYKNLVENIHSFCKNSEGKNQEERDHGKVTTLYEQKKTKKKSSNDDFFEEILTRDPYQFNFSSLSSFISRFILILKTKFDSS